MADLKLNLVIRLLDQATAPVRRLGRTVAGLRQPFQIAQRAAGGLLNDIRRIGTLGLAAGAALGTGLLFTIRQVAAAGDEALCTSFGRRNHVWNGVRALLHRCEQPVEICSA